MIFTIDHGFPPGAGTWRTPNSLSRKSLNYANQRVAEVVIYEKKINEKDKWLSVTLEITNDSTSYCHFKNKRVGCLLSLSTLSDKATTLSLSLGLVFFSYHIRLSNTQNSFSEKKNPSSFVFLLHLPSEPNQL